jgi:N-methylhydantoinase A
VTPEVARERFLAAYEGIFGLRFPAYRIEISTWGVEVAMPTPIASQSGLTYSTLAEAQNAAKGTRSCYLGDAEGDGRVDVPVFDRYALYPGWEVSGPVIIEEHDTTIFIPRGTAVRVAASFDLIAENEQRLEIP